MRGHGGGIALKSALGKGTTIRAFLPHAAEARPDDVKPERAEPQPDTEWTGSGLVLLVDDDDRVRVVTEMLLRSLGFDVVAVASGREALSEFDRRANELRLILLDLTMPDFGGDQVLRALKERQAKVPVLLCSGYSEDDASERIGREGIAGFLQKPYSFDLLKARLREVTG
jgi:CheY-like chemotaxis protein